MFDTVELKVKPIVIESSILHSLKPKIVTFFNKETGALASRYEIYDKQLPYIKYYDSSQTLHVQVSIPKFIYGDNVTLLKEEDIPLFFDKLQQRITELLDITVRQKNGLSQDVM
jgi:hypothetical protein